MAARSERVNFRLDPKLKKKMMKYCQENHTNLSDITTRFYVRLLQEDQRLKDSKEEPRQI